MTGTTTGTITTAAATTGGAGETTGVRSVHLVPHTHWDTTITTAESGPLRSPRYVRPGAARERGNGGAVRVPLGGHYPQGRRMTREPTSSR